MPKPKSRPRGRPPGRPTSPTSLKPLTAPARLRLLLPWLNGKLDENVWGPNPTYGHPVYGAGEGPEDFAVKPDYPAIRLALKDFVASFDGSASAAHVVAEPSDAVEALTDDDIGDLEAALNILLEQGFGENPFDADMAFPASLLRFAVRNTGRQKPAKRGSVIDGGVDALRAYRAPGAYVLRVQGPTMELVPFLLGHLLLAPSMVAVKRCEGLGCSHFVTETGEPGPPQRFCSTTCREWNRELEQQQVLKLVAEGRNNKSIADLLGISVKRVMSHRKQKQWRESK